MHRRNNSDGNTLTSAPLNTYAPPPIMVVPAASSDMRIPNFSRRPVALGEIQTNKVDTVASRSHSRSPSKQHSISIPPSPTKSFGSISLRSPISKGFEKKQKEADSQTTPKKTKSSTNLASLLGRPKTLRNLHKLASSDDVRFRKDKENQTPSGSVTPSQDEVRPPIYAQFSSGALEKQKGFSLFGHGNTSASDVASDKSKKPRPKSYHAQYVAKSENNQAPEPKSGHGSARFSPSKTQRGLSLFTNGLSSKQKAVSVEVTEPKLDHKDIDKHLEAMLDRRNIPENQRYKMRNLADTIKMEFIRQDWAESHSKLSRPTTNDSDSSTIDSRDKEDSKAVKRSRHRSFTLGRGSGKKSEPSTPAKKKSDATIGRHFRSKSVESVSSERPPSAGSGSGTGTGILAKMKLQQGPVDYVNYLRKVRKPELVEVGKLHKLRLLLRNETVAWTEDFIRQGGMEEMVGLLHRIMEVEWREEHEDALLHENLLCLKALCTISLAMQYLHSIQGTLFPALLHMLFDPEKKGPSEFTTRNIITSMLFTYIQSASPQDRLIRARTVLGHLRDPEPKEEERPVGFVLDMRRERPYRVWCKEAVSVTKEVFWIFLHHLNVVYLPRDKDRNESVYNAIAADSQSYLKAHFPQERPPVPAAPYVGGVEWDATNYLASHLDLLNAIIACTPTAEERNNLRSQMRISGWERCMGGSLRLCKEKFYPGVHDALRTWVAAAAEDSWEVRDVRYGPPAEPKSPVRKQGGGFIPGNKGKKKEDEPAPKLEIPKLDFGLSPPAIGEAAGQGDNWLS
ncbi:armadillo-type protein [Pseudomassariella vexata]|uniref:Armadillo-type protein n=1 Tax=Pseudomassariella vexata TaxID=1141098 RepID=A0A1Y2DPJ2_9PEZI|nr:armadillo-type protein [Pseudomassariella vexata]ORY61202.1 armadillo-type protein [Pseudomassariella vexata]